MSKVLKYLPEVEGDEQVFVAQIIKQMNESQALQFANLYRARRRDPMTILLMNLFGFVAIAGVHRFYLGQIGMGLLYLITGGFCLVGTVIDCFRYESLSFNYNQAKAQECARIVMDTMPDTPDGTDDGGAAV
jgi:TM2 domain-containing membrane protein YozV